jgi:hypothetical protein
MTKAVKQYIVGGDTNATARAARLQGVQDWCKRAGLDRIPSHGPHYKESQQAGDMAARQAHIAQVGDARALLGSRELTHGFALRPACFFGQCERAEALLESAGLPVKERAGAVLVVYSGDKVARAYKYQRQGQVARLARTAKDWRLLSVERVGLSPQEGGRELVQLTDTQRETVARVAVGRFGCV